MSQAKPLSDKQRVALEIGSVLRTLTGCLGNLKRVMYSQELIATHPTGGNWQVAEAIKHLEGAIKSVRIHNLQVATQNKAERQAAKAAKQAAKQAKETA